jgi:hypothetical protein
LKKEIPMKQTRTQKQFTVLLVATLLATHFLAVTAIAAPATKPEDRMNAVNRALEQSLAERAKSQYEFERNASIGRPSDSVPSDSALTRRQQREERSADRLASREALSERDVQKMDSRLDQDSREVRALNREALEESRREKRLNWLKD